MTFHTVNVTVIVIYAVVSLLPKLDYSQLPLLRNFSVTENQIITLNVSVDSKGEPEKHLNSIH